MSNDMNATEENEVRTKALGWLCVAQANPRKNHSNILHSECCVWLLNCAIKESNTIKNEVQNISIHPILKGGVVTCMQNPT